MTETEFALVPTEGRITKRRQAVLVQAGKHLVPSDRQFHPVLAAEYICNHGGLTRWILMGELARTFYMRDSKSNQVRIRQRLYRVWPLVLNRGYLLVYDIQRDGIKACKIYDPRSQEERQYLHARLERMAKARQLKTDQLQTAVSLAASLEATVSADESVR